MSIRGFKPITGDREKTDTTETNDKVEETPINRNMPTASQWSKMTEAEKQDAIHELMQLVYGHPKNKELFLKKVEEMLRQD